MIPLVICIVLNIVDAIQTVLAVKNYGWKAENNPVLRKLIQLFGLRVFCIYKLLACIVLFAIWYFALLSDNGFWFLACGFIWVVNSNYSEINGRLKF